MIFRVKHNKENPYYMMARAAVEDKRLDFLCKGILSYLLSKPDDWVAQVEDLVNAGTDGKHAIYRAIKDLIEYGYMHRLAVRDEDTQQFLRHEILTFETPDLNPYHEPLSGFPQMGKPQMGKPLVGNRNHSKYIDPISNEINDQSINHASNATNGKESVREDDDQIDTDWAELFPLLQANQTGALTEMAVEQIGDLYDVWGYARIREILSRMTKPARNLERYLSVALSKEQQNGHQHIDYSDPAEQEY